MHGEKTPAPLCILVVEDCEDDFLILKKQLQRSGIGDIELFRASRLGDALKTLDTITVDAILLDLGLPGSTFEATFRPVASKVGSTVPIVVLTGSSDPKLISRVLATGAQDFLIKDDVTPQMLGKSIRYAIDRARHASEVAKLQGTLADTESQLIQAAKMDVVGRLAMGLVHQLKNPLGTLTFGLDYITSKVAKDNLTIEVVGRMKTSVERADRIVTDLLDFSTAAEYQPDEVPLNELITDLVDLVDHRIAPKDGQLSIEISPLPEPAHVSADPRKLRQALLNILENAIDAVETSNNGVIRIDSQRNTDEGVEITITDNGVGILAEHSNQLLDPFFTTKEKTGGTGLGLSVVERIAKLHGGQFSITTSEGLTSARLSLPTQSSRSHH